MQRTLLSTAAAAGLFFSIAATGSASRLAAPQLPPGWSHAAINVVIKGVPHTLIYDRGRVQSVAGSSLTIRESGGSSITIDLVPSTKLTIDGQPGSPSQVLRLDLVQTLCIDGTTASRVQVKVTSAALALQAKLAARQSKSKHTKPGTTTAATTTG